MAFHNLSARTLWVILILITIFLVVMNNFDEPDGLFGISLAVFGATAYLLGNKERNDGI